MKTNIYISNLTDKLRVLWCLVMETLETDEMVQRRGFVVIVYHIGAKEPSSTLHDILRNRHVIRDGVPLRVAALHACHDRPEYRPFLSRIKLVMERRNRLRVRSHFGKLDCEHGYGHCQFLSYTSPHTTL